MAFTGFGPRAFDFYEGLAADNSKTYWQRHQDVYTSDVAEPLRDLATEIEPEFGEPKIFRPYRDLRFSADRRPYHEYARLGVRPGPRDGRADHTASGVLFLALSADGLLLASGFYEPTREQLQRFRALQDDPALAADLDATVAELEAADLGIGDGDPVKTAPRGWSKDHPRIEWIRRTRLTAVANRPPAEEMHDRRCLHLIVDTWRELDRWNRWLDVNVGP